MSKKLFCLVSFVLVLGLTTTVAKADIADGLVGYWPLDEGSGTTTADATGNGSDGTFVGDPQWSAGKLGSALDFDGNDAVDCGNQAVLDHSTNDWTVSAFAVNNHSSNPPPVTRQKSISNKPQCLRINSFSTFIIIYLNFMS